MVPSPTQTTLSLVFGAEDTFLPYEVIMISIGAMVASGNCDSCATFVVDVPTRLIFVHSKGTVLTVKACNVLIEGEDNLSGKVTSSGIAMGE